jgi:hypothetical protein
LKLYLAIDSSTISIFEKRLCGKGLRLYSRESDRREI